MNPSLKELQKLSVYASKTTLRFGSKTIFCEIRSSRLMTEENTLKANNKVRFVEFRSNPTMLRSLDSSKNKISAAQKYRASTTKAFFLPVLDYLLCVRTTEYACLFAL